MKSALKAEFRKLLSVRSTYIITGLVTLFVIFIAFYVIGWRSAPSDLHNPMTLANDVTGGLGLMVFGALIAILLMTHEYRYNTIMYTLTSSNSRAKVLLAKFITVSVYALFLVIVIGSLSLLMGYLGIHAHGYKLVPQNIPYGSLIWRCLFYGWGSAMAGLLLAILTRNQVASIVAVFVIPGIVEQLLSLLLKHNTVYLPFSALNQIINPDTGRTASSSNLSPAKAAGVYGIYLVVGWIVAWVLFTKRDAN